MIRAIAVLLVCAPAVLRADASITATPPPGALCVELEAHRAVSGRAPDANLWYAAWLPDHGSVTLRQSTLRVRDEHSRVVSVIEHAFFRPDEPMGIRVGVSGSPALGTLPALAPGRYQLVWTVDGVDSNVAELYVGVAPPPLALTVIGSCRCRVQLLATVYNAGSEALDMREVTAHATLIVDGQRHRLRVWDWRENNLLPGGSTRSEEPVPADGPLAPGRHRVALELGGRVSPTIDLEVCR
jgi:hypothetical protein